VVVAAAVEAAAALVLALWILNGGMGSGRRVRNDRRARICTPHWRWPRVLRRQF
jgi:hypothetical protein